MAVTHVTAARNALADAVDDRVNSGSTDVNGDLVLFDGMTELVRFALANPAFGSASRGQITLSGLPLSNTASASGMANIFEIQDRDNTRVFGGSVTATNGGGDMELDNTSINSGQTVQIDSFTYTAPT